MLRVTLIIVVVLGVIACGTYRYKPKDPALSQNWDESDRKAFYQTNQSSQLLKYDWFLSLERASSTKLFLEDKLRRFGYLPDPLATNDVYNSDKLPIGFVKDEGPGFIGDKEVNGPWIGMTCAACHTSEFNYKGKTSLIDGVGTNADFFALISELGKSLTETAEDDAKFSRFAGRVRDEANLRTNLKQAAERFGLFVKQRKPDNPWGKARLDAVTLIFNTVAYKQVRDDRNIQVPNAPVSYPFLWDTHQQPHNQWNGVSVGSLSRNTTEVLGVFATFNPQKPKKNSVQFGNLKDLQQLVVNLRSPKWIDPKFGLPPIDKRLINGKGKGC